MTTLPILTDTDLTRLKATILLATLGPDPDAARHWDELGRASNRTCRIPDCSNPAKAARMCDMHYRRHLRTGQTEAHLINRRAAADLAADVLDLLDMGETPARIPARVGASLAAIEKALRRNGHTEAAGRFEAERTRQRAGRAA